MKTISFKVTDDEARFIRRQAAREHLSLSEYLRRRASGGAESLPRPPVRKMRCEITGAEIFAPLADQAPLSTEIVRELLADFP